MNLDEFQGSLRLSEEPSPELSLALAALWWYAKGDWTKAHESAQRGIMGACLSSSERG
jgi:hypothetical protein